MPAAKSQPLNPVHPDEVGYMACRQPNSLDAGECLGSNEDTRLGQDALNVGIDGRADIGTGLVGEWLSASLLDLFGWPLTIVLLAAFLGSGVVLAFDLKWPKLAAARPVESDAES